MRYFSSIGLVSLKTEFKVHFVSKKKIVFTFMVSTISHKPEHLLVNSFHMQFSTLFRMEALESKQLN